MRYVSYRGDNVSLVQPQIITGEQFLDAMKVTL